MKLHEISNSTSLTPAQIKWLASAIRGTYEAVDGKIDVEGDVNIPSDTKSFPVQFGKVIGHFNCSYTQITSLEGSPSEVGGYFSCIGTEITSLKGSPSKVDGSFYCHSTQITSLEGSPSTVGGNFSCSHTQITSLEDCPSKVDGYFHCYDTQITSLEGVSDYITEINGSFEANWLEIKRGGLGLVLISGIKRSGDQYTLSKPFNIIGKYLGKPDLIFDCQAELIENGFEEYAQL